MVPKDYDNSLTTGDSISCFYTDIKLAPKLHLYPGRLPPLLNKHMHAPWESGVWDRGLSGTADGSQMGKAAFDGCLRGVKGTQAELNDTSGFKDTLFERWVYTSPNCCVRGATAFS